MLPGHRPSYRKLVEWVLEGSGGLGHGRGLSGVQCTTLVCFCFGQVLRGAGWSEVKKNEESQGQSETRSSSLFMPPKAKKRSKTRAPVITTTILGTVKRSRSIHLHVYNVTPTHCSGGRVGTAACTSTRDAVLTLGWRSSTGWACFCRGDIPDTERLQLLHNCSPHLFTRRLQKTASDWLCYTAETNTPL